jgi:hypothetical protein
VKEDPIIIVKTAIFAFKNKKLMIYRVVSHANNVKMFT